MMDYYAEALVAFRELLDEARASGDPDPTAMTLASVDPDGRPSARIVLLKAHDERGFVFYTNTLSRKGREVLTHPAAALLFHWKTLRNQVQVRIEGPVERVSEADADAYFASRPRGSQIGAWASRQSERIASRDELIARVEEVEGRYQGQDVPRPPHWGGYRLTPKRIEFWKAEAFRLHYREVYEHTSQGWARSILSP